MFGRAHDTSSPDRMKEWKIEGEASQEPTVHRDERWCLVAKSTDKQRHGLKT